MASANNLGLTQPSGTGTLKTEALNTSDLRIACAITEDIDLDFTSGNVTLTADQFQSNLAFVATNLTVARTLTLPTGPDIKRGMFVVDNRLGTAELTVTHGSTSLLLAAGQEVAFITDGTANDLRLVNVGGEVKIFEVAAKHWIRDGAGTPPAVLATPIISGFPFEVLDFDQTTNEEVFFYATMPKRWDGGTLKFRTEHTHVGGQTGGLDGVVWGLSAYAVGSSELLNQTLGTEIEVDVDEPTANERMVSAKSAAVTVANSPAGEKMVVFRLRRVATAGLDDMDQDARLLLVEIFATMDRSNDA